MAIRPSEGRVLELPKATEEQRKAISRVISAIKAARGMDYEKIHVAASGSRAGYGLEDEKNLQKGTIGQPKAAKLYRWIVENHLALGCQIAPEVFDPSLLTRWTDFVRENAIYGRLSHRVIGTLGLTERSIRQPIAELPIRAGESFYFALTSGMPGLALTLEQTNGKIYPFSLHEDQISVILPIRMGSQIMPCLPGTDTPDPLSDTDDRGLRCYYVLIARPEIIAECAKGLSAAHPISAEKLDRIALTFKGKTAGFELHRLNVMFKD